MEEKEWVVSYSKKRNIYKHDRINDLILRNSVSFSLGIVDDWITIAGPNTKEINTEICKLLEYFHNNANYSKKYNNISKKIIEYLYENELATFIGVESRINVSSNIEKIIEENIAI